jgi:hypothetical protein
VLLYICVETDFRHHVDDARPYTGSITPFGTPSAVQWLAADVANGMKVRPLGLAGAETG